MFAILLGGVAAFPSYYALLYRARTRLDDSLDVVSAHGVGGVTGALLTGVFAQKAWNGIQDGALFGNLRQLWIQLAAVLVTILYSVVVTYALLRVIALAASLRASPKDEGMGLDLTQHGEEAYSRWEGAILIHERRGAPR
jgi:Amt family ammonium transporter